MTKLSCVVVLEFVLLFPLTVDDEVVWVTVVECSVDV
jgi:hypothetical protein